MLSIVSPMISVSTARAAAEIVIKAVEICHLAATWAVAMYRYEATEATYDECAAQCRKARRPSTLPAWLRSSESARGHNNQS